MSSSDASFSARRGSSHPFDWEQHQGFDVTSKPKSNQAAETLETWSQQFEQEDVKQDMSLASLSQSSPFTHLPPPDRSSETQISYSGYSSAEHSSQPAWSHSSNSQISSDSTALDIIAGAPLPPIRDVRGPFPRAEHPSSSSARTSASPPPNVLFDSMRSTTSTRPSAFGDATRPALDEAGWLKEIYDTTQCFWLVSENRMAVMQEELKVMKARIEESVLEQERIRSQLSQILPLQVELTQKVVGAAEERRIIFGRIKSLEESTAVWQQEVKTTLDALRAELGSGLGLMVEMAPKARKAQTQRTLDDKAATAKTNKRASTPNKKTTMPKAKKGKTQAFDVEDGQAKSPALSATSSHSDIKSSASLVHDRAPTQHTRNDSQNASIGETPPPQSAAQQYSARDPQIHDATHVPGCHGPPCSCSRSSASPSYSFHHQFHPSMAATVTRDAQPGFRAPSIPSQQASYEQMKPLHRCEPSKPFAYQIQQDVGTMEAALRE